MRGLKTIFAIPEHQVPLPGAKTKSQNDVWVLGETNGGLVSIAVEGKVSETFEWTVIATTLYWVKHLVEFF